MKKIAAILFSFFYLAISVGIALNIHYCQGKFESIQLFAQQQNCCCGSDLDSSTCCVDDSLIVIFENEQTLTTNSQIGFNTPVIQLFILHQPTEKPKLRTGTAPLTEQNNSPPSEPSSWLLHCSLLFYG